jgi:hypothetical protein
MIAAHHSSTRNIMEHPNNAPVMANPSLNLSSMPMSPQNAVSVFAQVMCVI